MIKLKKKFIFIFILIFLINSIINIYHINHCHKDNCIICEFIQDTFNLVNSIMCILACISILKIFNSLIYLIRKIVLNLKNHTLVDYQVQLNG